LNFAQRLSVFKKLQNEQSFGISFAFNLAYDCG
jgi:hypothetical protein